MRSLKSMCMYKDESIINSWVKPHGYNKETSKGDFKKKKKIYASISFKKVHQL